MITFSGLINLTNKEDGYKPEVEEYMKHQEEAELKRKAPIMPLQELETGFQEKSDEQHISGQENGLEWLPERKQELLKGKKV